MNNYKTNVHGRCPIDRRWDYYLLEISSLEFIKCEDIEAVCDIVRGATMTQENIAAQLRKSLPDTCSFVLSGTHSNVATTVRL